MKRTMRERERDTCRIIKDRERIDTKRVNVRETESLKLQAV